MITVVEFDFAAKTERALDPLQVAETMAGGRFCWVDISCAPCGEARERCRECEACLQRLGINELARGEVMGPDREGRHDVYEDCVHFAVTESRLEGGRLATSHVDVVLGASYLVTFRRREAEFLKAMRRTYREGWHLAGF